MLGGGFWKEAGFIQGLRGWTRQTAGSLGRRIPGARGDILPRVLHFLPLFAEGAAMRACCRKQDGGENRWLEGYTFKRWALRLCGVTPRTTGPIPPQERIMYIEEGLRYRKGMYNPDDGMRAHFIQLG